MEIPQKAPSGGSLMRALICGTFNPPTNAHMDMGRAAQNVLGKDAVITYVPTGDQYIKSWKGYTPGSVMPAHQRLSLLFVAASSHGFRVSGIEVENEVNGKTYNTVKHFGFDDTVLCLGIDNIAQMKRWYKWETLVRRTRLLVYNREGYEMTQDAEEVLANARRVDYADLYPSSAKISSTLVRRLYKEGDLEAIKRLVPECVYKYLSENERVYF